MMQLSIREQTNNLDRSTTSTIKTTGGSSKQYSAEVGVYADGLRFINFHLWKKKVFKKTTATKTIITWSSSHITSSGSLQAVDE